MRIYDTRFCKRCQYDRIFTRTKPAARWHLVLTVATLGVWGIGWLVVALAARRRPWRCTICGSRSSPVPERLAPAVWPPPLPVTALRIAPRHSAKQIWR